MKTVFDFSTGFLSSYGLFISVDQLCFVDSGLINQILGTVIALIGGIISTIVLNILRAKFPNLFKPVSSSKKNDSLE